jgi:hypothetical protein
MPATLTGIAADCVTAPSDPDTVVSVKRAIHDANLSEIHRTQPLPSETATAASESISTYDVFVRLTEDLPASLLYHPDVLPYQNIYRILRDLLQRLQVTIQSTSPNERISRKVARTLYHSHETDLQLALDKISVFEQLGTTAQSPQTQVSPSANQTYHADSGNNGKVAHNVSMRMRNDQYSGAASESLFETISLYTRISTDYELTAAQRLKYFHNAFRGEALRYYDHIVVPVASIFAEAQDLMTQHFSSRTRQNKAVVYQS